MKPFNFYAYSQINTSKMAQQLFLSWRRVTLSFIIIIIIIINFPITFLFVYFQRFVKSLTIFTKLHTCISAYHTGVQNALQCIQDPKLTDVISDIPLSENSAALSWICCA